MTTFVLLVVVLAMYAATVAPVLAEDWPEAIDASAAAPGGGAGGGSPGTVLGTHVDVYA